MGILSTIIYIFKNIKKAKQLRTMGKESLLALEDEDFYDAIACLSEDAVYDVHDKDLPKEQVLVYTLCKLEAEVNNGGLCQFFVNSSGECAPFVSEALDTVGAVDLKNLYDQFIQDNNIDVDDLSSFKIKSIDEYEKQTERFDFDRFDDLFYEDEHLHQQIIDYARAHIEPIMKR